MYKVLITGITGFLGSHIAKVLTENGIQVIGLKRVNSDNWRCRDFESRVDWLDLDENGDWKESLKQKRADNIIHCAWIGVEAKDRDNWSEQIKNIYFLADLIDVMDAVNPNKFIFVGSQAEYGNVSGKISENETSKALNAYGSVKLACLEILGTFCELQNINWIWLRLFSVFGEKESDNWLIPSMINKMLRETEMDFTAGDQKYAYLYVKDFASIVQRILLNTVCSGVYNISSNEVYPLKSLIKQIRDKVNPVFKLNFGALPYRVNQSMHLEGDITKITEQVGDFEFTNFDEALQYTINYYLSNQIS